MRPLPSSIAEKLAASASLFAESGLEGTTMHDVARATGVPKATLYYYFSGKEDLFAHLLANGLELVQQEVSRALEVDAPANHQIEAVIEAQFRIMNKYPDVARAMFSELSRADRIPEIRAAVIAAYQAPVAQLLSAGESDHSLRELDDLEEATMAIFGSVAMTGMYYLARNEKVPDEAAHRIARLFLRGIATSR